MTQPTIKTGLLTAALTAAVGATVTGIIGIVPELMAQRSSAVGKPTRAGSSASSEPQAMQLDTALAETGTEPERKSRPETVELGAPQPNAELDHTPTPTRSTIEASATNSLPRGAWSEAVVKRSGSSFTVCDELSVSVTALNSHGGERVVVRGSGADRTASVGESVALPDGCNVRAERVRRGVDDDFVWISFQGG